MREIKFRAWGIKNERWTYGAYHKHLPYTPAPIRNEPVPESDYQHCIIVDGFSDWNMPRGFDGYEVKPETVGQYTGLKDKNGVEIYEGDIVDCPDYRDVVIWDVDRFGFWLEDFTDDELYKENFTRCKVIGNIYENPELLEKQP